MESTSAFRKQTNVINMGRKSVEDEVTDDLAS